MALDSSRALPTVALRAFLTVLSLPAALLLAGPRLRRETAAEAQRYADEVRVAATRADDAAQRWQHVWRQSEQHADEAWQAWQDAEQQWERTRAGAAFRVPLSFHTPSEYADRERFLHRAVAAAVGRGDLPATVMADLAAGHGGWNPRLHPVEQELVLHRAIAAVRYHLYRQAVAAEQTAWHDAELAIAARDSLRREADAAAARAAGQSAIAPGRERRAVAAARRSWVQQTA
ncbi:hypothetical protein OHA21_11345 [Actinoplanes sp. NBC_00393]|uniref:hypothetical protein n=1 Tax=Actinoplanes sp. NBC_00393 TaxID=2975953 RepID=UPI002E2135FD